MNIEVFEVEEYVKGSDYAPIFKKMFDKGTKIRLEKNGIIYYASMSNKSEYYVVNKPRTWLHASKKWLIENGFKEGLRNEVSVRV